MCLAACDAQTEFDAPRSGEGGALASGTFWGSVLLWQRRGDGPPLWRQLHLHQLLRLLFFRPALCHHTPEHLTPHSPPLLSPRRAAPGADVSSRLSVEGEELWGFSGSPRAPVSWRYAWLEPGQRVVVGRSPSSSHRDSST